MLFHTDHLTKDTKNVTLSIKAVAHTAILRPLQPQSEMKLPYSVYSTTGVLQTLADLIPNSPTPRPSLFSFKILPK